MSCVVKFNLKALDVFFFSSFQTDAGALHGEILIGTEEISSQAHLV